MVVQKAKNSQRDQKIAVVKLVAAKMSGHKQLLRFAATTTSQTLLKSDDELHSFIDLAEDAPIYGEFLASAVAAFI